MRRWPGVRPRRRRLRPVNLARARPHGRRPAVVSGTGRLARTALRETVDRRRARRRRGLVKVMLLHAFPLDERMWEPQRPALADHEVVAPNLYDLGGSSIDRWAEQILAD